jgi:hypothetical protein
MFRGLTSHTHPTDTGSMMRHLVTLTVLASIVSVLGGSAAADGFSVDGNKLSVAEVLADFQSLDGPTLAAPALGDCEDEEMVDLYREANQGYFRQIQGVVAQLEAWLPGHKRLEPGRS